MKEVYWIWLNALKGVSLESKKRLLISCFEDAESVYKASWLDLPEGVMLKSEFDSMHANKSLEYAEITQEQNQRASVQQMTIKTARDMGLCTELFDWPILVYYKGTLSMSDSVAVVGTRANTIHGFHYTKAVCDLYLKQGFNIHAGLSDGVESIALDHSLKNDGKFMAFVPHGPDICYPKRKWKLQERVLDTGAVISPFPAGVPAYGYYYLQRNALLAMWSSEVVLVEAPRESGSLSIACHGLKYAKSVYAVRGMLGSTKCTGNMNLIIDHGAKVLNLKLDEAFESLLVNPIVKTLKQHEYSFDELANLVNMDKALLTKTLLMLEHHRIIEFKSNGKWNYNGW